MFENKKIVSDELGNEIRLSNVLKFDNSVKFSNFSAKYVVVGNESYTVNGKKHKVSSGEYIVGNESIDASILIDSPKPVTGICIDISREKISEIIDYNYEDNEFFKKFLFEQEWVVNKYRVENTSLGYAINQIASKIEDIINGKNFLSNEIFYNIAECIVKDQEKIYTQFKDLKAVKEETNGRLLNFIYDSKNFIDSNFLENISLEEIAMQSKLSQYHFIRLFKKVFKITPYQYIIFKRLEYAKKLLTSGESILDVAYKTGFSNPTNFSRAYKNYFGISPKNHLI
jgi:AraC-like DNA-binding protein